MVIYPRLSMSNGTPKHTTPPPAPKGRGEVLLAEARLIEILMSRMAKIKRHHRHSPTEAKRVLPRPDQSANSPHRDDGEEAAKSGETRKPRGGGAAAQTSHWLYGFHAVLAAIGNPQRTNYRLLATVEGASKIKKDLPNAAPEIVDRRIIENLLPRGAVHQGIALSVKPLEPMALEDILGMATADAIILVLDQVTDPQNIGAALRNAAAFGATAVVLTTRHSTWAEATLAKAASGALDLLPLVRVTNLSRTLDYLKGAEFWCIGLADTATDRLDVAPFDGRVALILGAEGSGLRRLTRKHCDMLVSLPTQPPITSINIAAATAVALYEIKRQRGTAAD
jgi:23S rRNA (guanosine2251-2'-O)-methyltransferase